MVCQSLKDEGTKDDVCRTEEESVTVYLDKWIRESSFSGTLF